MQSSSELEDLITGYFDSFTVGDPDWVDRHVVNGDELRLIGTDPSEWLKGTDAFSRFRQEAEAAAGTLEATVSEVEAYSHGDVGWGAGIVRFGLPDGRTALARFSAVFVANDATWKLVSNHTSLGVPDEEAFSGG